jgi:hypothetical protein
MAEIGDLYRTQEFVVTKPDGTRTHHWFVVPDNMTREEAFRTQEHHGPFESSEEAEEDMRVVLLGDQREVIHGKPQ